MKPNPYDLEAVHQCAERLRKTLRTAVQSTGKGEQHCCLCGRMSYVGDVADVHREWCPSNLLSEALSALAAPDAAPPQEDKPLINGRRGHEDEVLATAKKLLEALSEPCTQVGDEDHAWRLCRRCMAVHQFESAPEVTDVLIYRVLQAIAAPAAVSVAAAPDAAGRVESPQKSAEWAVSNCHMLACREIRRLNAGRKNGSDMTPIGAAVTTWEHVLRICESTGYQPSGVLRE